MSLPFNGLLDSVIGIEVFDIHESSSHFDQQNAIDYLSIDFLGSELVIVGRELLDVNIKFVNVLEVKHHLVHNISELLDKRHWNMISFLMNYLALEV
jgi:hypothetical protein